jgi:hypothetical protein
LKKTWSFIWKKIRIFYTQGWFLSSLIEIGLLVLEKRIFKNFSAFLLFCYDLPLEKVVPLHLNNLESSSPKDDLCQIWLKLTQWFWRRCRKCKSLQSWTARQMDGYEDEGKRRSVKLTWAFSSGELKTMPISKEK